MKKPFIIDEEKIEHLIPLLNLIYEVETKLPRKEKKTNVKAKIRKNVK